MSAKQRATTFPDVLDTAQAEAFLGVNEHTLRELMVNGGLPHARLSARVVRFSRRQLLEWVEAKALGGAA